jgi:hypothetical protein
MYDIKNHWLVLKRLEVAGFKRPVTVYETDVLGIRVVVLGCPGLEDDGADNLNFTQYQVQLDIGPLTCHSSYRRREGRDLYGILVWPPGRRDSWTQLRPLRTRR